MIKYLDIKIYPNQSLSKKGFKILIFMFLLPAFLIGGYFSFLGAWPVAGFMGLEIFLIYFAFKISHFNNKIYEHIMLDEKELRISYHSHNTLIKTISLEPTWLKIQTYNNKVSSNILSIRSHGKENFIGKFLSSGERIIMAEKLRTGLNKWKNRNI